MPSNASSIRSLVAICILSFVSFVIPNAWSQITTVTGSTSTPVPGAGHDYIRLLSETVNPADGSVSVRLRTPTPPGRQLSLPFAFAYDSNGVHFTWDNGSGAASASWNTNIGFLTNSGWSYAIPMVTETSGSKPATPPHSGSCLYTTDYVFYDPSGGRHSLGLGTDNRPGVCVGLGGSVLSGGDDLLQASINSPPSTVHIADASGTAFSGGIFGHLVISHGRGSTYATLISSIEDRNGNNISITDLNGTGSSAGNFTVSDTLGRTLLSSSGFGSTGNTLTVAGLSTPYTVTWGTASSSFSVSTEQSTPSGLCVVGSESGSQSVITAITLPNSGQYQFSYDPTYGELSKITYPSGGYVSYTWGLNVNSADITIQENNSSLKGPCWMTYDKPAVTHRYVSYDGQTIALQQDFSYSTNWCNGTCPGYPNGITWSSRQTTVTTHDLLRSGQPTFQTVYTYTPLPAPTQPYDISLADNKIPLEQNIVYKDTTGAILKTVTKGWFDQYELGCELTTLGNGQISGAFYTYGSGAQVTDRKEYDYGLITSTSACTTWPNSITAPASPTRETLTNYQVFGVSPTFSGRPSILDRPCQLIVKNSSALAVAETDSFYDGSTSATPCSAATTQTLGGSGSYTGHDETNYGTTSSPPRGNLTSQVRKCMQSCFDTKTTYTYDETGQVLTATDANLNVTQYSYSDNYASGTGTPPGNTNARLTTLTRPTTNGVAHIAYFQYGYSDGQLRTSTDENGRTTTYLYNDPFARLTETDYPDGGKVTIAYNDAPYNPSTPSPSVTTSTAITSSTNLTMLAAFDGLGNTVRSTLTSDPDCVSGDRSDTTYDGLGRVYTVSNPYCTTSDPTYGATKFAYDALGRTTQVTQPDNTSTVLTTYTGRATQVQDEGNGTRRVTRISQVDGLGRLASVCEVTSASQLGSTGTPAACGQDIAGTGFLTTYSYDTLDNLTSVSQSGLGSRTFQYDSLSRLTSASNPESGTISYTYDANGNIITKTDARNITTCFGDWNGTSCNGSTGYDALNRNLKKTHSDGTPAVSFNYDQTSALGVTLTNTIGRKSSESTGGALPTGSVFSYDSMGRFADNSQCTPQNCGTGVFGFQYPQYDLLGDLVSATNAAGVTFTYSYSGAARLTGITTNFVDASHPGTLLSNATYNAPGLLMSVRLGNGITETRNYNSRLQMTSFFAGTVYSLNMASYAPNGDVLADNDSVNGNWTYSYDDFNRLGGSNQNSGQSVYSYAYDRFGNRWQQNGQHSMQLSFSGANNRMDGYSYDAAGNLLSDGNYCYAYDAENRITQVTAPACPGGAVVASYVYDAEGRRVRKMTSASTLDFLYDAQGHKVAEVDTTGTFQRGELYAGGRHLAVYAPDPGPTGATFFIHADWLGTERARTNVSGTACETITSLPFGDGQTISDNCGDSAGDVSPMHFTGKERDAESTLDNFGARYFSSAMGRFTSPDPDGAGSLEQDPQSWNMYAYARNNPLRYTDPDGRSYDVCVDNGNGGQNCVHYKNDADFESAAAKSGATLQDGNILVNGQVIGSYKHNIDAGVENGGTSEDNILAPALLGGLIGGIRAGIRGLGEAIFGGGVKTVVEETTAAAAEQIVSGGTKQAVREAVESSGLSDAAKAAVKSALRRGAAGDKFTVEKLADGSVKIIREVAGKAGGRAAYEQTIDGATGLTKSVVQNAYDAAGNLVHVDPKFP